MNVSLTWTEQLFAAQAGVMRRMSAISRNRSEPHQTPRTDLWGIDIESCGAEAAVAKTLGKYWVAVVDNTQVLDGDVSGVEVRSTVLKDGRLIVHNRDRDDAPFVLARGSFPNYEIAGWIFGRDAKQDQYIFSGDGRPAFFVPASELRPIHELAQQLKNKGTVIEEKPASGEREP
jgi:hypothetical protein